MAAEKSPAFQFYPRDWLADDGVALLTLDERGAYIHLLARCWLSQSLPSDPEELATLAGASRTWWRTHGQRVTDQFDLGADGRYRHPRLETERAAQASHRAERQASGRRGAEQRWHANQSATRASVADDSAMAEPHGPGMAEPMADGASSSSSAPASSPAERTPRPPKGGDDGFEAFWRAYPKHKAKAAAVKAWHKLDPDPALRATVLAALGIQRQSSDWTKENGRYIPNASTWLNGRRWEDEVSSPGDPLPFRPRAVAQPAPTYPEDDWCAHEPRCNSREWHAVIIAEESGA